MATAISGAGFDMTGGGAFSSMTTAARLTCVEPDVRRNGSMGICGAMDTADGGGAGGSGARREATGAAGAGIGMAFPGGAGFGGAGGGTTGEAAETTGGGADTGAEGSFESGRSLAMNWPVEFTKKLKPEGILPRDSSVCVWAAHTSLELPPPMKAPAGLAQ